MDGRKGGKVGYALKRKPVNAVPFITHTAALAVCRYDDVRFQGVGANRRFRPYEATKSPLSQQGS